MPPPRGAPPSRPASPARRSAAPRTWWCRRRRSGRSVASSWSHPVGTSSDGSARSGRRLARPASTVGDGAQRVGDERAVVVVVDRAVVLGERHLDRLAAARPTSSGVTKDGSQPSASRPTRRSSDGAMPPSHTSSGLLSRLGQHAQAVVVEAGAVVRERSRRSSAARITCSDSSNRRPARCARRRTPAARAGRRRRARTPAAVGRCESRSRVASSLASTTGLRPGSTITLMPNFSFVVRPAANAIATSGSGASPPMRSLSHRLSNRSRSSVSTTVAEAAVVQPGADAEAVADAHLHDAPGDPERWSSSTSAVASGIEANGEWSVSRVSTAVHRAAMICWWTGGPAGRAVQHT